MYSENDKNNYEYHYSYKPEYAEPIPALEPKPKRGVWKKVVACVLCGALLVGGAFSAGWAVKGWSAGRERVSTQLMLSDRPKAEVSTVNITGNQKLTFPEIYAANVDSCVSINITSIAGYNFFGQQVERASSGSGFVITKDGYIVTNYHVIKGANNVQVTLNDGATYSAQVIGGDEDYDIAVIKVDPGEKELKPVVIGSSDNLAVGDDIIAIGNPLGELTFSMSEGIVSCLNREINVDGTPFNMIQITAAVNGGNSGGPLFNTYGEVVGIVSAKYSSTSSGTSTEGLGFAIPINDVLDMIKDIMENGQVTTRPALGVMAANDSQPQISGVSSGVYIDSVIEGGPAANAGLQGGDVITMIGTTTISSRSDISALSKNYKAGDTVTVTFVRNGQVQTTELTFGSTTEMATSSSQQTQQENSGGQGRIPYDSGMEDFFEEFFGGSRDAA